MAYKLLVADDEYWVREKLRHIIDWPRYDIEFLEPACDGTEVLECIARDCPDILITDINMPGLNGVDLLEKLAQEHPEMVMLVISGYDTFEYVKRSMRSGAINYLLKPVSKIDMISAVSEALQILVDRETTTQEQTRQREQMLRASSLLQDRELSLLLDKQPSLTMPTLSMNVPLNVSGYSVVLMRIHDMSHAMEVYKQDINSLSYTVKSRLQSMKGQENPIVFNYFSRSNEFILLADRRESCSREAARKYMQLLEKFFRSPVTVVISDQSYALSNIRVGYLWAESQLWRRAFSKRSEIVQADTPEQPDDESLQWTEEISKQLVAYLVNGNRDMVCRTLLHKTGLQNVTYSKVSCGAIIRLVNRMNHVLQSYQLNKGTPEDAAAVTNLAEEVIRSVETLDIEKVCARENELIDAVVASCPVEQTANMKSIVKLVQDDIDAHYYEELTLTSLAQKYIVERSYLSRCFKQETGENLMMYLAKRRIGKAIEHMKEDRVGLTEISFLVGYDDYTYFSRVFKKVTGISPREYKARLLAENEVNVP